MKVITEAALRNELRLSRPESYTVPEGKVLSPAAREFLQSRKIAILKEGETLEDLKKSEEPVKTSRANKPGNSAAKTAEYQATDVLPMPEVKVEEKKPKFIDFETGAFYYEKPEHMTHLVGNVLVFKNSPRILFRGKMDSLGALIVLNQTILAEEGKNEKLIADLQDVMNNLRELTRCEILEEPFTKETIIGLTHAELREHSHNPMKFYNIKQMVLPDYTLGKTYALLNQIRAAVREVEVAAADAFQDGRNYTRSDIIEELNRMSSALHIIQCKYLAGAYDEQ